MLQNGVKENVIPNVLEKRKNILEGERRFLRPNYRGGSYVKLYPNQTAKFMAT